MHHFFEATTFILPLIIAITLHEAAHGFVADKLGDNTARLLGRVSFDPLKHVELFGTIILPALMLLSGSPALIGWAKPVPVNFRRLNHPRRDTILVALAGPFTNIVLALISAVVLRFIPEAAPWTFRNFYNSVAVNIVLAVFNLLPILPLDGGRVLKELLPRKTGDAYAQTEQYGMIIILLLFMLPAFLRDAHIADINIAYYLIYIPANFIGEWIFYITGLSNS